ncbi:AzlD domain-containing protein [Nodosilinea sp. LEGE 06152]|uniref:AzlD domain-containing protein n=1 Tax=Nodosilinea sp. LEGE 06152 TaxID=2777966 RepID=UPI00187F9163|nr:AzlD domain-containing protein [Nodosilinea sp. LEGE 06152]MBE9155908.1 AzlD domain-containing protein [Nodosilinea sp. LEGE 06152]
MTMGWVIFLAGLGTYAMRSTGLWVSAQVVQLRWLGYLPLAVILVMAVSSVSSLTGIGQSGTGQTTLAAVAASTVVVAANLKQLPLVVCIALGCAAFGLVSSYGLP